MISRRLPIFGLLLQTAACATAPRPEPVLLIEDRPAENIIRIANPSSGDADIFYNIIPRYGPYQMLRIRFRDGEGRLLGGGDPEDGWFTPMMMHSSLPRPGEYPRRDRIRIAAGGRLDLARDIGALTQMMPVFDKATAPCELQIMLAAYRGPRSSRPIRPVSNWTPAACPEVNARRPDQKR